MDCFGKYKWYKLFEVQTKIKYVTNAQIGNKEPLL